MGRFPGSALAGEDDLLDYGGDLHARYGVGATPVLCLVRPDGYIGFRGDLNEAPKLVAYLRRFEASEHGDLVAFGTNRTSF